MVLECFTWIPHLLCSLIGSDISHNEGFGRLPDDILINILSRLPADSVLQCRRVCRHWRRLTSSSYFIELQNRRAPTVILVQYHHEIIQLDPKLYFYIFDENARKLKNIRLKSEVTMKHHNAKLISSCGGLLLFRTSLLESYYGTIVLNLITREESYIISLRDVCGLFFHPLASEYKLLQVHDRRKYYRYKIYSFALKCKREIASSPFSFRPACGTSPAIVNLALHWIVDYTAIKINGINPCMHAVMVFRMDSEELCTLPHPTSIKCNSSRNHGMMHLFVKDDHLALCHVPTCHGNIHIWILEDYANWYWVRRHIIKVDSAAKDILMRNFFCDHDPFRYKIKVLSTQKDGLLIDWFSHGLYFIDLTRRTSCKIDVPRANDCRVNNYSCVAYTNSLVIPSLFGSACTLEVFI